MPIIFDLPGIHRRGIYGLTISNFVLDVLHVVDLGVAQSWAGASLVEMLESNIYEMTDGLAQDRMATGLLHLKSRLRKWYSRYNNLHAAPISKIDDLTLGMVGAGSSDPSLSAKGAESRGIIGFILQEMMLYGDKFRDSSVHSNLFAAGGALKEWYTLMAAESRVASLDVRQRLMDSCVNHLELYGAAGFGYVPKHHLFIHLTRSIFETGNCRFHTTYEDESLNLLIRNIGRKVHSDTFAQSVLERVLVGESL